MRAGRSGAGKQRKHTWSVASSRPRQVDRSGAELRAVKAFYPAVLFPTKFSGTEPLDNPHGPLALRAEPEDRCRDW